ncbi:MAG TPA: alpha/beta fold hydrolase, partial [Dokdonella sp.]
MPEADPARSLTTSDHRVPTARGALFARVWEPAPAAPARPPIVLFHDSLGCVETWRGFPSRLAEATRRRVVGYDRLGFGRSDPRSGALDASFIGEEAALSLPVLRARLGFDAFVAFGHSVGGAMALAVAAEHAGTCEAVVSEAALAFVEPRTLAGIRAAEAAFAMPERFRR